MLSNIKIYDQNEENENLGYDNCDSFTNGEFFVVDFIINNGMMVFDIGANVGAWSKYVKSKHENCKINCFEPVKSTYNVLCENFKDTDIKCNNYAISKDNKNKTFYFYGPTLQLSELSTLYQRSNEIEKRLNLKANRLIVNCITVDDFCKKNDIDTIDYLKIDTEGAEVDVLTGCEAMLQNNNINIIQFEYGGCCLDSGKTLQQVYNILKDKYNIYRILSDGLLYIKQWNDNLENYLYCNYLAILK